MIEFKTRFEQTAWDTFKRFYAALKAEGFATSEVTGQTAAQIAATLTHAALTNALDAEVGNVVDQLVEHNRYR